MSCRDRSFSLNELIDGADGCVELNGVIGACDKSKLNASVLVGVANLGKRQDLLTHVHIFTLILDGVSESCDEVIRAGNLFLNLTEVRHRL